MNDNTILSQEQLAYALKQLNSYSELLRQKMPEGSFSISAVQQGLMADFNSEEEIQAKKTLIATAIETVYNNEQITQENKEEEAVLLAKEILEKFDLVKVKCKKMTPWKRAMQLRVNEMAKRATRLLLEKPALARLLSFLPNAVHIAHVFLDENLTLDTQVALCIMLWLVPEVWKKQLYNKPRDEVSQAIYNICEFVEDFKQTKVYSRMEKCVYRMTGKEKIIENNIDNDALIDVEIKEKLKEVSPQT